MRFRDAKDGSVVVDCNGWNGIGSGSGCGKVAFQKGVTKWGDKDSGFLKQVRDMVITNKSVIDSGNGIKMYLRGYNQAYNGVDPMNKESAAVANAEYTLTVDENSKKKGTQYLTGAGYGNKPTFTEEEQFALYQDYLLNYYQAEVHCDWNADMANANGGNGYVKVKLSQGGSMKTCYVKKGDHRFFGTTVGGIDANHQYGVDCNFDCVVEWLRDSSVDEIKDEENKPTDPKNSDNIPGSVVKNPTSGTTTKDPSSVSESGDEDKSCDELMDKVLKDGEKIGSMQWILCPSMDNTKYTASWIDKMTDDWLLMDPKTYSDGAVQGAWDAIRNISNTVMVIFLLVIIFSQLTGYGIDNYGIKKMLPRLIVMAILVNLSWFICIAAADLSNIFGYGLRNLFGSLANSTLGGDPSYLGGAAVGMFAAAGGGSTAIGAGVTAASLGASVAVAVIIAIIVLALIILVAVMILFLMLGVRLIIVIICIILSPLAFASFILPNTQSIFKKWWDAYKAALIIYPICGLLAGISHLLRSIFSTMDLPLGAVAIAMIMPYLGFFLIPTLLKSAIAALGKFGGALTAMGNSMRNGGRVMGHAAAGMVKNSEAYKNMQNEAAAKRQQRYAQRTVDKVNARERAGKTLSDRDKLRRYNAQQTLNDFTMQGATANAGATVLGSDLANLRASSAKRSQAIKGYTDQYSVLTRSQMGDELRDAVIAYNEDRNEETATRLLAATATAESRGMNAEMLKYIGNDFEGPDGRSHKALSLSAAGNRFDAEILNQLAGSSNKVFSQYGIQMGKPANVNQQMSMREFAMSTGPVKMSEAFENKGPAIMNNMDDDTLSYINEMGKAAGAPIANAATLASASAVTTNQKEIKQLNEMYAQTDADKIQFSGQQLASFDASTLDIIQSKIKPGSQLQQRYIAATNDIQNSPDLMGSLRPEQRDRFNAVRRSAGHSDMGTPTPAGTP